MSEEFIKADLAIIGAGSGGLSIAAGAAQLGLKVVLFEKGEMGGDCLNYGCVPSKALISAGNAAYAAHGKAKLGVSSSGVAVDFAAVMAHVHDVIASIAPVDSQERFEGLGVRVVREAARFSGPDGVESDSVRVQARKYVIATGSSAAVPPIPGLADRAYLTNETIFELKELPRRLIVLGGGPIGVELGQAFRRLGSEVVIVEAEAVLGREEPAAAKVVIEQLLADGVEILAGHKAIKVEAGLRLTLQGPYGETHVEGSHLLVAVGRRASIAGLNLDAAGVKTDRNGVITDASLRSSNPKVFAVGDVAGRGQFTHLAGAHASLFVRKALFAQGINADGLHVPRVTYTSPEIAGIGLSEAEARKQFGDGIKVLSHPFHDNDRALAEADSAGFGQLITTNSGKILGVSLVGKAAGDLIQTWSLALSSNLKLTALTSMIAPYPTRGEMNKRLAGMFYTPTLFSDRVRKLVSVLKLFG